MITGSIVALATPMTEDGSIDWKSLEALIDWHAREKTDGLVALGTTGESATLTDKERTHVLRFIISKSAGRFPVIAGTGTNSTQESIYLTAEARSLGADACLLVVPYYNRPGQEGLFQHFRSIADAVSIPQILYNVPGRTITDLLPETVMRLMDHENIVGIKEATGNMQRAETLIQAAKGKNFAIYSGDDATAMELMRRGGHGTISVVANVAPAPIRKLCKLIMAGQTNEAEEINESLSRLYSALFIEANPIPVKWALEKMGMITDGGIRLPLTPLASDSRETVLSAMHHARIPLNNKMKG